MESVEKPQELQELAPEAAEYISIFLGMLKDYEAAYERHPEGVVQCFPAGIQDDTNEIIFALEEAASHDNEKREKIAAAISSLKQSLLNRPVALFALQEIFDTFPSTDTPKNNTESRARVKIANLTCTPLELETFLRACGLEDKWNRAGSSHKKWYDTHGKAVAVSVTRSNKLWLKNTIYELLDNGFPIESIFEACRQLKIDIQVIAR